MKVPLTVVDYIRRAELVYGDRVAIVDEPNQPAVVVGLAHVSPGRRAGSGPGGRPRRHGRRRRAIGSPS